MPKSDSISKLDSVSKFDLITEPWISVVTAEGRDAETGLREALAQAHRFAALRDPLPTVEFGLYRLLTALVLDIFQPRNTEALANLLDAGQFDGATLDAYFSRWAARFDLFDAQHPFLQIADMGDSPAKPLAGLLHPMPSGTNAAHFHHAHEEKFGVSPAAAARLLATIAPFMTAGGTGLSPSINGAPPWYALVTGRTLFETLCMNLCVLDLPLTKDQTGPPAWRDDRPLSPDRCRGASLAESLTWRPRRLRLVPGEGGACSLTQRQSAVLIRTMQFGPGASCDFLWRDPHVPYKVDDKGPKVMRPQEGKEAWRETGPLALLRAGEHGREGAKFLFQRPLIVEQFAQMSRERLLPDSASLQLSLFGLRTDLKMKVYEWQRETLSVPKPLVLEGMFHLEADGEMEKAEKMAYALRSAIKLTYPRDGAGNKSAFAALTGSAERGFWQALRPCYEEFLDRLAGTAATDEAGIQAVRRQWQTKLKEVGQAALDDAIGTLDTDAEALARWVKATEFYRFRVQDIFATLEEREARAAAKKKRTAKETH